MIRLLLLLAVLALALFLWWRFVRVARPAIPPLAIPPDDPAMLAAVARARESVAQLRALAAQPNRGVRVKLPFVTSSGVTEFLWAEVLSVRDAALDVRYLTPPVTHSGRLERLHTHTMSDVVDWVVELPSGRYAGGFTMRAMFTRGREQWGSLPPELEAEERRYGADPAG